MSYWNNEVAVGKEEKTISDAEVLLLLSPSGVCEKIKLAVVPILLIPWLDSEVSTSYIFLSQNSKGVLRTIMISSLPKPAKDGGVEGSRLLNHAVSNDWEKGQENFGV